LEKTDEEKKVGADDARPSIILGSPPIPREAEGLMGIEGVSLRPGMVKDFAIIDAGDSRSLVDDEDRDCADFLLGTGGRPLECEAIDMDRPEEEEDEDKDEDEDEDEKVE